MTRPLFRITALLVLAALLAPAALAQDADEEFQDPVAGFQVSPQRPEPGREVRFTTFLLTKAFAPCDPIVEYAWDFDGDGEFEEVTDRPSIRHVYEGEGVFEVTLRVTDGCDQVATASKTVTVIEEEEGGGWLDFGVVFENRVSFIRATWLVLWLSTVAILVGLPLGVVIGLMRLAPFAPLRWVAGAYIEFIRGTPLLVQIFIVWLALPQISPALKFGAVTSGLIALIINTSAYQAEIIRAGIQAIPSGQTEAALGMGLSRAQTMRFVILPQALRLVIPPLTNEFIILIKDTSLLSVIGVVELMLTARVLGNRTFNIAAPLFAVAIIYFVMTYSLSLLLQYLERRLAIPGLGMKTGGGAH